MRPSSASRMLPAWMSAWQSPCSKDRWRSRSCSPSARSSIPSSLARCSSKNATRRLPGGDTTGGAAASSITLRTTAADGRAKRLGRQAPAVPVGEVAVVDGLQGRAERAPLVGGQHIADRVASRHERVQDETATVVQLVPERGRLRPNRREDVGDAGVEQRAWHLQVRLADRLAVDLEEPATSWPGCLVRGRARVISGDERERGCLDAICGQPRGCQFGVVEAGSSSMRHLSLGGRWRALQIGSRCRQ